MPARPGSLVVPTAAIALLLTLGHAVGLAAECRGDALAYEAALLEGLIYRNVEYPARIRSLHNEIELTRAEIETLERLLGEYRTINRFQVGSALTLSAGRVRLELLAAEKRLDALQRELALTRRFRPVEIRLREIEAEQSARLARSPAP